MVVANTKIVQAYVEGLVDVVKILRSANEKAQALKTKFTFKNPDLTGTNVTAAQVTAVNNFISDLSTLSNSAVSTTLLNKNQPSHGTGALD